MVTGPLRVVLWVLGALAVLWLILGLAMLPAVARVMGGGMMQGGMMDGTAMGEGMMCCGGGMMGMMGLIGIQLIAMLGLVAVFFYLVVDAKRRRSSRSLS